MTLSGGASDYVEQRGGLDVASGSASYASRFDFGDIGIRFDSTLRSDGIAGNGRVTATSRFVDYVTLASTSLPIGTPVALTFSGSLDWSAAAGITGPQSPSNYTFEFWNSLVVNGTGVFAAVYGNVSGGYPLDPNNPPPGSIYLTDPHTTFAGTINARVGDRLMIQGSLYGNFLSYAQGAIVAGQFDALGSAHTYMSASDTNVELVALSGHNYAAPVPEPGTWALLVCGLGLLFALRKQPTTVRDSLF